MEVLESTLRSEKNKIKQKSHYVKWSKDLFG